MLLQRREINFEVSDYKAYLRSKFFWKGEIKRMLFYHKILNEEANEPKKNKIEEVFE